MSIEKQARAYNGDAPEAQDQSVYIVFTGKTDIKWLKILKPGFRHCFALINDGHHWISVDPLSNYTDVMVHYVPADFNFPDYLTRRGHIVMQADTTRDMKPSPLGIFSCVEAVKRIIGLHNRFIITPWQLYRHLARRYVDQNINS